MESKNKNNHPIHTFKSDLDIELEWSKLEQKLEVRDKKKRRMFIWYSFGAVIGIAFFGLMIFSILHKIPNETNVDTSKIAIKHTNNMVTYDQQIENKNPFHELRNSTIIDQNPVNSTFKIFNAQAHNENTHQAPSGQTLMYPKTDLKNHFPEINADLVNTIESQSTPLFSDELKATFLTDDIQAYNINNEKQSENVHIPFHSSLEFLPTTLELIPLNSPKIEFDGIDVKNQYDHTPTHWLQMSASLGIYSTSSHLVEDMTDDNVKTLQNKIEGLDTWRISGNYNLHLGHRFYLGFGLDYTRLTQIQNYTFITTDNTEIIDQVIEIYNTNQGISSKVTGVKNQVSTYQRESVRYQSLSTTGISIALSKIFKINNHNLILGANAGKTVFTQAFGQYLYDGVSRDFGDVFAHSNNNHFFGFSTLYAIPLSGKWAMHSGYQYLYYSQKGDASSRYISHTHSLSLGIHYLIH
ncbi:MAG: hypothetical protein R2774_03940 [Saprospiraceae bacterium]